MQLQDPVAAIKAALDKALRLDRLGADGMLDPSLELGEKPPASYDAAAEFVLRRLRLLWDQGAEDNRAKRARPSPSDDPDSLMQAAQVCCLIPLCTIVY